MAAAAEVSALESILARPEITITPLFGKSEDRLQAEAAALTDVGASPPDLSIFYRVQSTTEVQAELAEELRAVDAIDAVYVKPSGEPPQRLNDMTPLADEAPTHTPDFVARQGYLEPAPGGVDARYGATHRAEAVPTCASSTSNGVGASCTRISL